MSLFFVHRPVFAWVLAIVTMLAGAFALTTLTVSQYPDIAPTTVRVSASYPGATAEAVQGSVTQTIEDGLTGLDGLLYVVSNSNEGSASITLTFDGSVEGPDAQTEVQARVSQVERSLPDEVQRNGVSITRSSSSILMVGALVDTTGSLSTVQLGDLLSTIVEGPVQRTAGVGGINAFGSGYAMRIWLDPLSLAQYQLTPADIVAAVEAQNTTVSVGALGTQPVVPGQQFTAAITAQSQLSTVEEFEGIQVKAGDDTGAVYLGDVARVEIGQERYGGDSRFDGLPASGFGVNLATGANAVDTAEAVRETLDELATALPEGVEVRIAYDTSPFVELSIEQVYHTLAEAVGLVFLVILIFLQTWRATLVPLIAIPVVLLGTFGVLAVLGYSINTLTLFAMVLAIGLLVDDAIVVVENVERVMEEGLGPMEATERSMGQITGALIGIALTLSAVFLPMAFFGGSTGVIYRQFSVTIIAAMVLSAGVALTLSPALCASILRPRPKNGGIAPARAFNRAFAAATEGYAAVVRRLVARPLAMIVLLALVGVGAWQVAIRLESSFLPAEDQGVLMTRVNLTEGATTAQTTAVVEEIERYMREEEGAAVESTFAALGFGFSGTGQNTAMLFVKLRDWEERGDPELSAEAVAQRANARFSDHRAGRITIDQPPAIPGLGNSGGFSMYLVDQTGAGVDALQDAGERLAEVAEADARVASVRTGSTEDESALRIVIDQQKAESFGVSIPEVNAMLSTLFSGSNVNDFTLGSELRPVIVQAAAESRMQPEDVEGWYARNSGGEMVPFVSFITTEWAPVPPRLSRIDGQAALSVSGQEGEGVSSGEAMDAMEEMVAGLGGGWGVSWTDLSYQERQSGNQAPFLYALSVLVVFLCLAALYESWAIPFSVMLAVPVGVLGALGAAWLFAQSNDVYFKVGLLTTIGLAAKNAILIVEFARDLALAGRSPAEAAVEAARLRLRPILMTSLAFLLGVTPLALASGAGAGAQRAIGIGVIGGTLTATFIGIFMVPAFFVLVSRLTGRRRPPEAASAPRTYPAAREAGQGPAPG